MTAVATFSRLKSYGNIFKTKFAAVATGAIQPSKTDATFHRQRNRFYGEIVCSVDINRDV
jgi:hypothetical protein